MIKNTENTNEIKILINAFLQDNENQNKINTKIKKIFPFYSDLETFDPQFFVDRDIEFKTEINSVLQEVMENIILKGKTKGQKIFKDLYIENKENFLYLRKLHDGSKRDMISIPEFNLIGLPIKDIIDASTDILCSSQEKGNNRGYSSGTEEAYKKYVKFIFPWFDDIGVEIRFVDPKTYAKS